ncbi:MAG: hypothetical protein H6626_01550 [Pseudobdellovibrionaceae bacterium]|nr:hypothetical protein [Bdellovibrionales bacterium]USN47804.1 MAG: hypothetical protein H6626_01550 [Pseudobdellovibrionaceae bacterium]
MKASINYIFTLTTLLAVVGCTDSGSNPVKDYDFYPDLVAEQTAEKMPQATVGSDYMQVIPDNDINFVEGEESTFKIRAYIYDQVSFNLKAFYLPAGAVFQADPTTPNTWNLTWKPNTNFIDPGQYDRQHEIEVELVPTGYHDVDEQKNRSAEALISRLDKRRRIPISVRRSDKPPVVELSTSHITVNEGDQSAFQVNVKAPGTHAQNKPRVVVMGTGQKCVANGASFIYPSNNNPIWSEDTQSWVFSYTVDTNAQSVPTQLNDRTCQKDPKAASLISRFLVKAFNPSAGTSSPEELIKLEIKFAPKKPVFSFASGKETIKLFAGALNVITFSAYAPDGRGQVEVLEESIQQFAKLGEKMHAPETACKAGSQASQVECVVAFKPLCGKKNHKETVEIKAKNTTDSEAHSSVKKAFEIDNSLCAAAGQGA